MCWFGFTGKYNDKISPSVQCKVVNACRKTVLISVASTLILCIITAKLFETSEFNLQPVLCVREKEKGVNLERILMQIYHFPYEIIQATLKLPST